MTSGTREEDCTANVLRKAAEVAGSICRCLVSHSARRGPTFNTCLSAGTDPGSILHVNLRPVPGFSGEVKVFCYTGISQSQKGKAPRLVRDVGTKLFMFNFLQKKSRRKWRISSRG